MIKSLIRTIPDHPKPGILFRDITTLLQDAQGLRTAVERLSAPYRGERIDKVVGIEARGFILGGAVAVGLGVGYVPVRKKGKLPWKTFEEEYALEYGTDVMEIHEDGVSSGERVLLIDDLIATGGTAAAATRLIERCGGEVVACAFIVDLPDLGGRRKIEAAGHTVLALCEFEGE